MTTETRETLRELAEILRYGANKRLESSPHYTSAHILHDIANEIVIALALPEEGTSSEERRLLYRSKWIAEHGGLPNANDPEWSEYVAGLPKQ